MKRPASITNEEAWHSSCQKVVIAAEAILAGEIGIVAGARKQASLRFEVEAENDADFIFFVGVDSQTDHLPLGDAEKHWNSAILESKRDEIKEYESLMKDRAHEASRNLLRKYAP
jgi:hypothetical protein